MKPRPVHTMLLGDQNACAKRLPFAQAQIQALFTSIGDSARTAVRHFEIDGDRVDLTADRLGGRIVITSTPAAIGELRAWVYDLAHWELFKVTDLTEVEAGRIDAVDDVVFSATEFVDNVGSYTLAQNGVDKVIRKRNMTGALVWTQSIADNLADAWIASAGTLAIYATDQYLPAVAPETFGRVRYALVHLDAANGGGEVEVETLLYHDYNPVSAIPSDPSLSGVAITGIAGPAALFADFHLLGYRVVAGSGPLFRPTATNYELHLMDGATLASSASVTLESFLADPKPHRVLTDDTGIVYLFYASASSTFTNQSLRAYDRSLARRTDLDFAFPTPVQFLPLENIAVVGDFCYVHERNTKNLMKLNRAGDIVATFVYPAVGVLNFDVGVLTPIRKIPPT